MDVRTPLAAGRSPLEHGACDLNNSSVVIPIAWAHATRTRPLPGACMPPTHLLWLCSPYSVGACLHTTPLPIQFLCLYNSSGGGMGPCYLYNSSVYTIPLSIQLLCLYNSSVYYDSTGYVTPLAV